MAKFRTQLHQGARRYPKTIEFRGTDMTSPRFQVAEDRSIDSLNYLWKDGAVHKRHGLMPAFMFKDNIRKYRMSYIPLKTQKAVISPIEEVDTSGLKYSLTLDVDSQPVCGIWFLKNFTIVHIGTALFYAYQNSDTLNLLCSKNTGIYTDTKTQTAETLYYSFTMPRWKCQAFESGGKLWILTGVFYYCIEPAGTSNGAYSALKMTRVSMSDDTYVPTTTIGITAQGTGISGRASLESPNLLTQWRKNGCVSGIKASGSEDVNGTHYYTYSLDAPINPKDDDTDTGKIRVYINTTGKRNDTEDGN